MNQSDYEKKLLEMLTNEKTYKHLSKDLIPALQKIYQVPLGLKQSKWLSEQIYGRLQCNNGVTMVYLKFTRITAHFNQLLLSTLLLFMHRLSIYSCMLHFTTNSREDFISNWFR